MRNKATLALEVSSEKDRDSAVTRLKEDFSESYVVEGPKMLLPKLTVVGFPLDKLEDEISATCGKDEQLYQLIELRTTLVVVKFSDVKNCAGDMQKEKFARTL